MTKTETAAAPKSAPRHLRPAKANELDLVHGWLMQAIDESPYYNATFKAHERARMSRTFVQRLHETEPSHIMCILSEGSPAGFMISSPEYGALWLHWSYVLPEKRRGSLAMSAMRSFIAWWDNGRFHKISTFTKHGNDAAKAVMERYGFALTCTLENHMFGEDYLLYECQLTKAVPGYDSGIPAEGMLGRIKRRIGGLFGRGGTGKAG